MHDDAKTRPPLRLVADTSGRDGGHLPSLYDVLADRTLGLKDKMDFVQCYLVTDALKNAAYNVTHAADALKVSRTTVQSIVKKHNIDTGRRPRKKRERLRMLFVDDDAKWRAAIMRRLKSEFDIDVAIDKRSAIAQLKESSYDLILCDVYMPDGTGTDVYEFLREHNQEQAKKFIFVSGVLKPDTRLEDVLRRDDHPPFLSKPFEFAELAKVVSQVVGPAISRTD